MKRTGLLGGTFDPVHAEHVNLAKRAIEELSLDELIVMPTHLPPHKNVIPAPDEDRLNMLRLAFVGEKKVTVSDFEIKAGGKSYTYITVEKLLSEVGGELFLIVGGDMLADFKTWKNPERILGAATLCAFGRQDFNVDFDKEAKLFRNRFGKDFIKLNYTGKSCSSTKIRIYSALGLDVAPFTGRAVAEYIANNNIYSGDKYTEFVKQVLPEKRRIHTAGVALCAVKKAKEENIDRNKAFTAAVLHDCAKYLNPKDYPAFVLDKDVPEPVVHAFLGAYVAQHVLGIEDEEIIDAIRYHTSGKAGMSPLAKLIFTADMVEENRTYNGVETLRKAYEKDLDACFKECLAEETEHLKKKGQPIYKETINAYNYYVKGENNDD